MSPGEMRSVLSLDMLDGATSCELLMHTIGDGGGSGRYRQVGLAFGAEDSEIGSETGSVVGIVRDSLEYYNFNNGGLVTRANFPGDFHASRVTLAIRVLVSGGVVTAKIWEVGSPEPNDWQITGSAATSGPYWGLYGFQWRPGRYFSHFSARVIN